MEEMERIVNFIFEVGTARRIFRTHRQVIKNADDSLAEHSFRTAIIGMVLAELEGADKSKVAMMCLIHDLPEIRTGDANFINAVYRTGRKKEEKKATQDQWIGIPGETEISALISEYEKRETKEAIVAKDADRLDQIFLQCEYLPADSYDLKRWHNHIAREIKTESARKIAELALKTSPLKWFYDFSDEQKKKKEGKRK